MMPTPPPPDIKGTPKLTPRHCAECGAAFWPARHDQRYCTPACRHKHHRRRYERGAKLYDLAVFEWRGKRTRAAFVELTQLVDGYLRDERARQAAHRERIKESRP